MPEIPNYRDYTKERDEFLPNLTAEELVEQMRLRTEGLDTLHAVIIERQGPLPDSTPGIAEDRLRDV